MHHLPNGVNTPFGRGGQVSVKHRRVKVAGVPGGHNNWVFPGVMQMHCVARVKPPPGGQIGGCVSRQHSV
jgi:hypothetical protein